MKYFLLSLPVALALTACGGKTASAPEPAPKTLSGLDPAAFESVYRGDSTALYQLRNADAEVCVTNFGGRIVSLTVADRDGNPRDVVMGLDSVQAYFPENNLTDFGASIGRYANRINQGSFALDGKTYQLPQNNFGHCLHGGGEMGDLGWQYRVYKATQPNDTTLILTLNSPDGDNGFPGNVEATVTYTLHSPARLEIDYQVTTDAPTIINMTNHAYFNLSGEKGSTILNHLLRVNAESFTPVDSTYMTSGEIRAVEGTPFDFRKAKAVGRDIAVDDEQLRNGNGYDHNFVLATEGSTEVAAATLESPESGIVLNVYTNEPGIQLYTGNFLDSSINGKGGTPIPQRGALCLETQHYPDSPNKPEWPSTVLRPGETYKSICIYDFSVNK
ncbi:MAG: galactose mutarotase [Duncaniella sp.]|nr:galactose mutarotase [Duncaniella sp.]